MGVRHASCLSPDPPNSRGSLQALEHLPYPSYPSGMPVSSGLHLSSPLAPPPCPTHSLRGSSHPLGCRVPHQCLGGALVVVRCELRILPLCHLDSAPNCFLWCTEFLSLLYSHLSIFGLLTVPLMSHPRIIIKYNVLKIFCYVFFKDFSILDLIFRPLK